MNIAPEDFMSEEEWMIVTEKLDLFRKVIDEDVEVIGYNYR